MNARTGERAADVAWGRPPAIPVALIVGYNGSARPTRAQIEAWARPFLLGFESSTTRAYAGGDAGEADAAFSCASFDEFGYPLECGSWVCAADANSTPAQFLPNIEEYGYRYALRMMLELRFGPILVYGNPAAVEALCAGIRRAGLVALRWGVGTWGYGEGGGANQPPAEADVELLQSGNTPGPAAGTDLDWLYAPVAVFGAWGGPAAETRPPEIGDDDVTYLETRPDGSTAYWKLGLGDYFEIPEKVARGEELNGHGKAVPITTGERVVMGLAAGAQADAYLAGKLPGGEGPPVDLGAVRAAAATLAEGAAALTAAVDALS